MGIKPVFDRGPITYLANANVRGGRLVMPDASTGRVKETTGAVSDCLGVATGNASAFGALNADTLDAWGNTVVNAQYPPNEVAVAYQGIWRLTAFGPQEQQTITQGGSGLVSYTLTFSGQTTASILQAATAAEVQAALEALSNINVGDVTVTGNSGGPYTVTFGGQYLGVDVPQMTATPTGGTGTVTIATIQAGATAPIAFGALVVAGAAGTVATIGANTFDKVIGRCVEPAGMLTGGLGKILLGGVGA